MEAAVREDTLGDDVDWDAVRRELIAHVEACYGLDDSPDTADTADTAWPQDSD